MLSLIESTLLKDCCEFNKIIENKVIGEKLMWSTNTVPMLYSV